jgi:hypothetical protein
MLIFEGRSRDFVRSVDATWKMAGDVKSLRRTANLAIASVRGRRALVASDGTAIVHNFLEPIVDGVYDDARVHGTITRSDWKFLRAVISASPECKVTLLGDGLHAQARHSASIEVDIQNDNYPPIAKLLKLAKNTESASDPTWCDAALLARVHECIGEHAEMFSRSPEERAMVTMFGSSLDPLFVFAPHSLAVIMPMRVTEMGFLKWSVQACTPEPRVEAARSSGHD